MHACMNGWILDSSKAKGTHIGFSSLWLDDHARARQASERTTSSSSQALALAWLAARSIEQRNGVCMPVFRPTPPINGRAKCRRYPFFSSVLSRRSSLPFWFLPAFTARTINAGANGSRVRFWHAVKSFLNCGQFCTVAYTRRLLIVEGCDVFLRRDGDAVICGLYKRSTDVRSNKASSSDTETQVAQLIKCKQPIYTSDFF